MAEIVKTHTVPTRQRQKVLAFDDLAGEIGLIKAAGKTVAQCHGVFDLLHIGHIWHLQEAKAKADVLIVTLTPDEFVNKGPHRPAFPQELRAQALAALDIVDFVTINKWPVATEAIKVLKPSFYVKGPDYKNAADDRTGKIVEEEEAVRSVGGEILFTTGKTFSASTLINQHLSVQSDELRVYLQNIKERYSIADIVGYLESLQDLKVLIVGETIIDEYQYCEAIGKSSKEPTLVVKLTSKEVFPGGVLNIGNHAAGFSQHVSLITQLGEQNSREDVVQSVLKPEVKRQIVTRYGAPTIVKRRYIDNYFFTKLFETYEIDDSHPSPEDEAKLCQALSGAIQDYDVVIVADYGHGFFSDAVIESIKKATTFWAVNVQSNAGNLGYQSMKKYAGAPFFSVDENEIRLEARNRRGDIESIIRVVASELTCDTLVVTRGKHGSASYNKQAGLLHTPALAGKVVDRVGAGDAFLTVAAMCAAKGVPADLVGFMANVAGAQAVATVGNKKPLTRLDLIRSIESLLK